MFIRKYEESDSRIVVLHKMSNSQQLQERLRKKVRHKSRQPELPDRAKISNITDPRITAINTPKVLRVHAQRNKDYCGNIFHQTGKINKDRTIVFKLEIPATKGKITSTERD